MTPMEIEALVNGTNAYGSIIGGRWPNGIVPYVIDRSISKENEFYRWNNFIEFGKYRWYIFSLNVLCFLLKIRNFAGRHFWGTNAVSRSKNCEIYRVFFNDRIIYCEFRGICLRNRQIWKVLGGNNFEIIHIKVNLFSSKLRYIYTILLSCTYKSMFIHLCNKTWLYLPF